MNNPAAKNREDVITDLQGSEFSPKQARAVVQAVVDTTASLNLATHEDIAALKTEIDRLYRFIFWGFTFGLGWLSVLLMALGWLVNNN